MRMMMPVVKKKSMPVKPSSHVCRNKNHNIFSVTVFKDKKPWTQWQGISQGVNVTQRTLGPSRFLEWC